VLHQVHGRKNWNGINLNACRKLSQKFAVCQVKDNNLNDERFLRMIEAMYDDDDAKFEAKLVDYDTCANLDPSQFLLT